MMDVPDDAMLLDFVPGSEEAVADFDLSLLGDVVQQCPANRDDASSSGCSSKLIEVFLVSRLVLGAIFVIWVCYACVGVFMYLFILCI